jgi:NADH-quinone oxidoreductase subunit E
MNKQILPEQIAELNKFMDSVKSQEDALIPCIHEAQRIFKGVPVEVQKIIANANGCSVSKVSGIVSFYDYLTSEIQGENIIEVCVGTSCYVNEANAILDKVCEITKCKPNGTSKDGKYSVIIGRCLGRCELAPNVIINHKWHTKVDEAKVIELVEAL